MKRDITVKCLLTVPNEKGFEACTLALKTLRIGWPTAKLVVYVNSPTDQVEVGHNDFFKEIIDKERHFDQGAVVLRCRFHHAEWIRSQVETHMDGSALVLVDGDTVWWKNCETWEFPSDTLLAGYHVPVIWNDFSKCVSESRIHTSCMVFPDTVKLTEAIVRVYPWAYKHHGDYCPCDPFMPAVRFIDGQPRFWDSCANLYQMLWGYNVTFAFTETHLECYDHLNSAAFFDVMHQRMDAGHSRNFAMAHDLWVKNPVPGLWKNVNAYYREKQIQAQIESPR